MTTIKGRDFSSSVLLTRTNDANAYSAGDVIGSAVAAGGAVLTLPNLCDGTDDFMVTTSRFRIDTNAIISGMTSFTLQLYSASPPSNLGDNAAWDLSAGDRASYLGNVTLGTPVDVGSTLYVQNTFLNTQFKGSGNANGVIFAYLVTVGAWTPTAQLVFYFMIHAMGF